MRKTARPVVWEPCRAQIPAGRPDPRKLTALRLISILQCTNRFEVQDFDRLNGYQTEFGNEGKTAVWRPPPVAPDPERQTDCKRRDKTAEPWRDPRQGFPPANTYWNQPMGGTTHP